MSVRDGVFEPTASNQVQNQTAQAYKDIQKLKG